MPVTLVEKPETSTPEAEMHPREGFSGRVNTSKEELFRLTAISSKANANYKIKYQTASGIEWLPEQERELGAYLVTGKYHESLFSVISRAFDAEWGTKDIRITNLKFHYAEPDDKGDPKRGIEPKAAGELIKITIGAEYQSQSVISKKSMPWLTLGAFDQYVSKDIDDLGYLKEEEIVALQDLLDAFSRELARKLNEKIEFKPKQLKLI